MANDLLAETMRAAGMSNKALARAVREASGGAVNCDHTSVSRWLAGMQPRSKTASLIAEVLGAELGRTVALAEIGFSSAEALDANVGTGYGDTVEEAITALGQLWRADLDDLRTIVLASLNNSAWSEASLSWLVRSDNPDPLMSRPGGVRVGTSDVMAVRATANMFAQLDNQFGGGHARRALIQYLKSDLAVMLDGNYTEATGRQLYSAAAEATLLAAWMSYDAGVHGLAQRYFIQALRLAQAADDIMLAGSILDAMSHQATFLGRHREAANLARAARTGTRGRATAGLTAHFHAMEARALSVAGDATGAHKALSETVRIFERRQPGADPEWISYFDDAELSAEFSHCFRDIGRYADAVTYADRALAASGTSARSDFFVTMVQASGYLGEGEVEQACQIVRTALDLGAQLKSARCVEYLRQFRAQLAPFRQSSSVAELNEFGATHALWVAASMESS